ncbi:hypothetical protein DICPUDRAFT_97668 [Dictyostelium purpureum]|uniref:Calponin-homology (CH) domain-containing protein n=1 Tax=Dictyostelium purpureum TaxID=5786 RepID=F0ZIS1_DICPU|nr:uncharacterized protein DICPUDRAFT_97668 [Dictyostelium purpureum]EGC36183.1 hypothetical protein DICPUDRAFT_97668 [Dictyostelium purpureum]|eukprot:XP_003287316.1 hypothetical protein DICPUDRAFT_97668 [Dictyostelium purpureum]
MSINGRPSRPSGGKKFGAGSVTITMSDFQTYEMQAKQMECKLWIESVLNEEIDNDLHQALKDGVVLCKLANVMFPGIIPRFNKQSSITFKLLENINSFLGVLKKMGINERELFIATDLWENKNFQKIVHTLSKMATIAIGKGFPIKWPIVEDPNQVNKPNFEQGSTEKVIDWDHSFIYNNNNGTPQQSKSPNSSISRLSGTPKTSFGLNSNGNSTTNSTTTSPYRSVINYGAPIPKQPSSNSLLTQNKPTNSASSTPINSTPTVPSPLPLSSPSSPPQPLTPTPQQQQEEKERLERLEKEKLERERLEKERLEKERLEKERLEKEQKDRQREELEKRKNELDSINNLVKSYEALSISDNYGMNVIHYAIKDGQIEIVKMYTDDLNVNLKTNTGRVNLNCTNSEIKGYAPIHILISTEEPRLEIIELLLSRNINVNIKNINGSTPLHLAVFWNHFKVLELLLKYNAGLDEKNNKGRTPLSLACHYGNETIAKYLAEKTNKDIKKLKIKNNKQKILDMEIPDSPPVPNN